MKRKRVANSCPKHSLPDDLCREILSFLPVKSLLRFRTVSSSWRSLIADQDFARLHLARFDNNRNSSHLFAVQHDPNWERECVLRRSNDFRITSRLGSFGAQSIVSSIDGLFMLRHRKRHVPEEDDEYVLWNPSIRKTLSLPRCPAISVIKDFGLGFDPSSKDYKYVRFSRSCTAIYTLGSNSWKTVDKQCSLLFDVDCLELERTVCFRGYLVSPATRIIFGAIPSRFLALFDLTNEVYASVDMPGDNDPNMELCCSVGLTIPDGIGGRSMQLVCLSSSKLSVWVLDGDSGWNVKAWSWIQRFKFAITIPLGMHLIWGNWGNKFLYLLKNGDMLFSGLGRVISINPVTHGEKMMMRKMVFQTWPYMESLILH